MRNSGLFSTYVSSPCKDCMDREVGCHSTCEKYIKYQKEKDEYNKKVRDAKSRENDIVSFKVDSIRQYKKTGTNNKKYC